jgi:hypothetical protein
MALATNMALYAIGADSTTIISFSKTSASVPTIGYSQALDQPMNT